MKNVQLICSLWTKGYSFKAMAKALNGKKLKTRLGKNCNGEVIKRIVERHKISAIQKENHEYR